MRNGKTLSEGLQTGHNNDRLLGKGANGSSGTVALEGHPDDLAVPAKRVSMKEQAWRYVWTARLASRASNGRADCADESSTDTSGERSRRDSSRSSTAGAAIGGKREKLSAGGVDADPWIADPRSAPLYLSDLPPQRHQH
jgi:hypothetical protein